MSRIDAYNHVIPGAYFEKFVEIAPDPGIVKFFGAIKALHDTDAHTRLLDSFDNYRQVISLANPPVEMLGSPEQTPALACLANDGLAEWVRLNPDRIAGFIASLPMNNPDAAVAEANRAVNELNARGVQVFTNVLGKPLSAPEFYPVFETLAKHDLPVWIHPMRGPNFPDYAQEDISEFEIWFTFGWPYETSACMTRLIYSGLFDKLPDIKIITHHFGGMVPFFAEKIGIGFQQIFKGNSDHNPLAEQAGLKKQPKEYFKMFYADTATNGSLAAAKCGLDFFGPDHSIFASDTPFDPEGGAMLIRETINAIDNLGVDKEIRDKIYSGNLERLLRLS
ncbi:MAG: amidohydrolase family protein [Pseudomonadota bacterium]|nr:amidohydrolase family protein [Pseudomonadota bacterium]